MAGPIASAVMLPEPQEPEPQPPALSPAQKRRQSSISEQDAKRRRLSSVEVDVERRGSITTKPPAAAPPRRERGRERRLFGAALGALSQNSATPAQKRRSEIEKRQLAQRKIDEEESEQRKLERGIQRKAQRQKEQKLWEKDSMRIRHDNLLSMAQFLRTESEPRLFYKPWATTADEDDLIQDQINKARKLIQQELDEYEVPIQDLEEERSYRDAGRPSSGKDSNANTPHHLPTSNGGANASATLSTDPESSKDDKEGLTSTANSAAHADESMTENILESNSASHEATADQASKDFMDENGEEVLEAAEDTVIY